MGERITLNKDDWAFDIKFFIQLGLYEVTGYGDWKIKLTEGDRHNQTDGEIDYYVKAERIESFTLSGNKIKNIEKNKKEFRVNGNGYSGKSIFDETIEQLKKICGE
jgi:hypothetical protein